MIHTATRRPAHNTPIHIDLVPFNRKPYKKSMWIGVLWAGLRVAMWITHVGGKFRHGLLEKSLRCTKISELFRNHPIAPPGPGYQNPSFSLICAVEGKRGVALRAAPCECHDIPGILTEPPPPRKQHQNLGCVDTPHEKIDPESRPPDKAPRKFQATKPTKFHGTISHAE